VERLGTESEAGSAAGTLAPSDGAPGSESGGALLEELERLLVASDPEAVEHFVRHRAALRGALGDAAEGVERDVAAYDFERAAAGVQVVLRGRGTDPTDGH